MSDSSIDVQLPDSLGGSAEVGDNLEHLEQPHKLDAETSLEELRDLMFGQEINERVDHRIASFRVDARNMADVLPDAVTLAPSDALVTSIRPTVENSIKESVNQEQEILADALFPIIGPATRKAVTSAIKTLTDSLNQGIELSLSPKSIGWRLESWRTGRPFAEVVLLRTLLYQVEQVLLIHKETGLMLQDVVAKTVSVQDPDLVSSMLTAIEDFVRDSFTTKNKSFLESVDFGDLTLWIEDGPQAVLACMIRGVAPTNLRLLMQETLEKVHRQYDAQLDSFSGDRAPFDDADTLLQDCLLAQSKPRGKKRSPVAWIAGALLLGILILTGYAIYVRSQWESAMKVLEKEPGITVVRERRGWFRGEVKGLRDPLALDPGDILQERGIKLDNVTLNFEPYLSLSPQLLENKARQVLAPPQEVDFSYDPNTLTLTATGQASYNWIQKASQFPDRQSRVERIDTSQLSVIELERLKVLQAEIEQAAIAFRVGRNVLEPKPMAALNQLSKSIKELTELAQELRQPLVIYVRGQVTATGDYARNVYLSQSRADLVVRKLVEKGIPAQYLKAEGIGVRSNLEQASERKKAQVSFRVEGIQP